VLVNGQTECFLRPDAALYTIVLSDEEDSSCSPVASNTEGCANAAASLAGGFGSIEYWSRFFSGIKGAQATSRLAAIVATESTVQSCGALFGHACDKFNVPNLCTAARVPLSDSNACYVALGDCYTDLQQRANFGLARTAAEAALFPFCAMVLSLDPNQAFLVPPYYEISGSFTGCAATSSAGVDFTAISSGEQRTAKAAVATGGLATSICQADYTPALQKLGLQAAGLRADFPLSRAPLTPSSDSLEVKVNGATMLPGPSTWQYSACATPTPPGPPPHAPVNLIHFTTTTPPGAEVKVSYFVNVRGLAACP
jgi:hypothetical protein